MGWTVILLTLGNGSAYLESRCRSLISTYVDFTNSFYLTEKHSHILFESCSGGGGRNDLGMIRYSTSHRLVIILMLLRLPIQYYGLSYLLSTMGAHVNSTKIIRWDEWHIGKLGHVAMMGNLGYERFDKFIRWREKAEIANQRWGTCINCDQSQLGNQYRLIESPCWINETAVRI